jgi:hypothetical protein
VTLRGQHRLKTLSYRDQTGKSQEAHQEHWRGFQWSSGRVICSWVGSWGEIQVWASSEAEGRRVINHACAIAGIPFTFDPVGELVITEARPGRNGRSGTYGTAIMEGSPVVTKREGPSGSPFV